MVRQPPHDLTALFDDVEAGPRAWNFFALVRSVEQAAPASPRVGTAMDPAREVIDLAHEPSADFPRTTVSAFTRSGKRPKARSAFLGLTGPMGPLPFHLTEIAVQERSGRAPTPFADFLDLISSRMIQAFYRAWADGNPAAQADRPADDRFAAFVGAISGAASLRFVTASDRSEDDEGFDAWRRLAYGGQLAGLSCAAAIGDVMSHLLGRPVTVVESVGRWRRIPVDARTRLGGRLGVQSTLGAGATLGGQFFSVEWDVTLRVRAHSMEDLGDLLPGGRLNRLLAEAAEEMLPPHLDWDARIEIDERAIEPAKLGQARLGQTGWVGSKRQARIRDDVRLEAQTMRRAA